MLDRHQLSRRRLLVAGATGTAALAGCLGGDETGDGSHEGEPDEFEAYVAVYHWGFAAFDEDGTELEQIEVEPNTEVVIHAVNDHAYDAFDHLPNPVAANIEEFDALGRTKGHVEAGRIAEPEDETVESVYEDAHGHGNDHGDESDNHDDGHHDDDHHDDDHHDDGHHDDDGHDDHHDHEDALLDHGFMIPDLGVHTEVDGDAAEPATVSFVVDEPGTYEAQCTVHCGYGHDYQQRDLIVVTE